MVSFAILLGIVISGSAFAMGKGLAIGVNPGGVFLFATNFHAGTVDVYDGAFHPATLSGSFSDSNLPAGYAPFGIANIHGDLFVTFALSGLREA